MLVWAGMVCNLYTVSGDRVVPMTSGLFLCFRLTSCYRASFFLFFCVGYGGDDDNNIGTTLSSETVRKF